MSYKKKLMVGFGSLLSLLIILFVILSIGLSSIKDNISNIVDDRYKKVTLAQSIKDNISSSIYDLNDVVRETNKDKIPDRIKVLQAKEDKISAQITEAKASVNTAEGRTFVIQIETQYQDYLQSANQLVDFVDKGKIHPGVQNPEQTAVSNKLLQQFGSLTKVVDDYKAFQENYMTAALNNSLQTYKMSMLMIVLFTIAFVIVGALVARWVIRSLVSSLEKISNTMSSIELEADTLPRLPIDTNDEVGAIAGAFNGLAASLEAYNTKERSYIVTIEEQNWLKSKSAELSNAYQGISDLKTLAETFLSKAASLLNANCAVFYVLEAQGKEPSLVKTASYAGDGRDFGTQRFRLGEGLIGQCALEKRIMRVDNVPAGYMPIKLGSGEVQPANILIAPVMFDGEVGAVIEFTSLTEFTQLHEDFLEEVLGSLGINIYRIRDRMEIERLLQESQSMTEELQAQSEQLQSQNEEMQMQSEELRMINERLQDRNMFAEQKAQELQQAKHELEDKAEQLMISSRYKSEFLANMSHELRTPLNSMLILSEMLAADSNLSEEQLEFARVIHDAGRDLLNLINDILDLSKVEAGKLDVVLEDASLQDVLYRLESTFSPLAKQKGLDFNIVTEDKVPELVHTDEQRLQQILKNLLSNAVKFTEQGSITMHVRRVNAQLQQEPVNIGDDDYVLQISVTDTGIGVPKDKQELIFEAFKQANGTTSRKYGGTGLGLAISREYAKMLGGWITLDSEEGKGSTFTLYLPSTTSVPNAEAFAGLRETAASAVAEAEAVAVETPLGQTVGAFRGKKILIADDDNRNVFALQNALETEGIQVVIARDGRESLEALEQEPDIDLVLMDIMMPEMDGYEAIRAIRTKPHFSQLPVIALTAKAMKNDREKCLEAGASDYISKPLEMDQLFSVLRVWLTK